ncbi:threonine dehydratase, biosynthetic, partial [Aureobasidium melanogenum]
MHSLDQSSKGTRLLGDGDHKQSLLLLTNGSALSDETQTVKVHVGAGGCSNQLTLGVRARVLSNVLLQTSQSKSAGRLENGASVVENILDGSTSLIGSDHDDIVDNLTSQTEGLLSDSLDSSTVSEQTDLFECDTLAQLEGFDHSVCIVRLDTDDLDVRRNSLDVDSDTGDQTTTTNTTEDSLKLAQISLAHNLHTNGSLTGDNVGVVEGRNVGKASFPCRTTAPPRRETFVCLMAGLAG